MNIKKENFMKSKISFLASIGFVVVVCLLALPVFTQGQELKAQGST